MSAFSFGPTQPRVDKHGVAEWGPEVSPGSSGLGLSVRGLC